jgi:hypothetical protein
MSARAEILAFLEGIGIAFDLAEHPPVHTIEDCARAEALLGCVVPKNPLSHARNRPFTRCA